jgi:hypothetical protein
MTKSSPGRGNRRTTRTKRPAGLAKQIGFTPGPKLEIPVEKLGHPGALTQLHVVPQFASDGSTDQTRLTDDAEREFQVAALLSKTPVATSALNLQFGPADGGSYFVFAHPAMAVDTPWGTVRIDKNSSGEASYVSMTCRARSANDALEQLQRACSIFLDHWSYQATAPVYLTMLLAKDLKSQVQIGRFTNPFRQSAINPSAAEIPTPLRPVLALYREGLCAASPLYKFLCFYKILEGYFSRMKPKLAKIFRDAGQKYPTPADLVPDHPELDADFRAYIGQSIQKFRDERLTPDFRVAVAHFEKDGEDPLVASDPSNIVRFNHTAFAVELCVGIVIESYGRAFTKAMNAGLDLTSLGERGGIGPEA